MEKDLFKGMGINEEDEEEEEEKEEERGDSEDARKDHKNLEEEISDLQLQVENSVREVFDVPQKETTLNNYNECLGKTAVLCSKDQNNIESKCDENNENISTRSKESNEYMSYDLSSNAGNEMTHINDCDDTRSIRSVTTASTIAPDVIKKRIKSMLDKRERKNRTRILVKGEANAVTRQRRDNRATIKEYESSGIWGGLD